MGATAFYAFKGAKMHGRKLIIVFIALFMCAFGTFIYVFEPERVSEEVLDLFPQNESKALIEAHRYFASSKYIPIFIDGVDENAQTTRKELINHLENLPHIASVVQYDIPHIARMYDFLSHSDTYILSPIRDISTISIDSPSQSKNTHTLNESHGDIESADSVMGQKIFAPILASLSLTSASFAETNAAVDSVDSMKSTESGAFLATQNPMRIGDKGFMILAEIENLTDSTLKETLKAFKALKDTFPALHYFSADFMRVENLGLILQEVNVLLGFASLVFIVLYFVIIRIPFLTLTTIATLIFSNMIAILLTLCIYPKVTIMALSFGMGISNIAIDYMMHHHFFGLYTHTHTYAHKKAQYPPFNLPVFLGYFTTMIGFGVCCFIPFPLLAQLSLYAMISLTIAYISFAFIYPRIGFKPPRLFKRIIALKKPIIPGAAFLLLSVAGLIFALSTLKLDFDLSKLDYANQAMLTERAYLQNLQDNNELKVLIYADDKEALMLFLRGLIEHVGTVIFHKPQGISQLTHYYTLASLTPIQYENLHALFAQIYDDNAVESLSSLWNPQELAKIKASHIHYDGRALQEIMDGLADSIYKPMLIVLGIALVAMLCVLAFSVGRAFVNALSFVLFPLSAALSVVASHSEFNMMHLFALLILVVVSVDYGIYTIKEGENPRTTHAILFSALTTGVSFGLLITSQTKALNSFGEVIFSGMSCILILLICGRFKGYQKPNKPLSST